MPRYPKGSMKIAVPLLCRQSGLRHCRPDAAQKSAIDRQLPAAYELAGKEQRLVIAALPQTLRVQGNRNHEVREPIGSALRPGTLQKKGKGTVESDSPVKLEAVDGVTKRLFIEAGRNSPDKCRGMKETFAAEMIAAADSGKREGT